MPRTRLIIGADGTAERVAHTPEEEAAADAEAAAWVDPAPPATPLQLFDELDQTHGIDLETEIGAVSQKALRRFRLAGTIKPDEQFALALQARLGWTDAQRMALFRAAAARG